MMGERDRFDRAFEHFEMQEPALELLRLRQRRRARAQRLTAAAIGIIIVGATAFFLVRSFGAAGIADQRVGATPSRPTEVRSFHNGLGISYVMPDGWNVMDVAARRDLILDAGGGRLLIMNRDVWAGPVGCGLPDSSGSGPRCRIGPAGILDWLWRKSSLEVDRFPPAAIGGYDVFFSEIEPARGVSAAQPLLRRNTAAGVRPSTVVSVRPGRRVRLYIVETPLGTYTISLIAPRLDFDAFVDEASPVISSTEFTG